MENEKPLYQKLDFGLISILLLLASFSLVAIYEATIDSYGYSYVKRQTAWYIVGFIVIAATLLVDYRKLKSLSIPFYSIGILLLIGVALFGEEVNGAQRWIDIGSFSFQPSELMKIFLIIMIAFLLLKAQEKYAHKSFRSDALITAKITLISIVPFGLVLQQPDLGTALVLIGIVAVMLLVAGISWRVLISLIFAGISFITWLVVLYFVNFELFTKFVKAHQLPRILGWLDPYEHYSGFGYQLIRGIYAIGSGQLYGKRFDDTVISAQHSWIPEVHTDFIFAVIGEQFGFIGASILISLFFILIYRLVQIALTCNDRFGSYVIAGITGSLVIQTFQNIGMTIGLMPITGLALPFISYGGSALLTNMLAMGIVLNVSMRTRNYMFDS